MRSLAVVVERFEGPEALAWREVEVPAPRPSEVLVEVHAAGVNYPDLLVSRGTYQDLYPLPFVIGKEGAGIIRAVGSGVSGLSVGDRVAFQIDAGAFGEIVLVPAKQCYPVPAGLALGVAAGMVLAYQTAYFALVDRGALKSGEWVLVLGASGGVGIATVQLARVLGGRVIAAVGSPDKGDFARVHGALAVVNAAPSADLQNTLRPQIREITDGHGIDLIIDMVGGNAFDVSLRTLAPGGRLAVVGFASGQIPSVKVNYLLLKHISVLGVNWGVYRDGDPEGVAEVQAKIFDMASRGLIASPVTQVYPMSQISSALFDLEKRRVKGKIVLTTKYAGSTGVC